MQTNTKTRAQLKNYFQKGDVPTSSQFGDFIDACINKKEDGITKDSGKPLSVQAEGGMKKLLDFYSSLADTNPSWSICQNPMSNPKDASTAKPGFSINDASGQSRLFIKTGNGQVGIGTVDPKGKLAVSIDPSDNSTKPLVISKGTTAQFTVANNGAVETKSIKTNGTITATGTISANAFVGEGACIKGMVIMWSGPLSSLPKGWAVCDGTKGTPDLRSRFIVGSGKGSGLSSYNPGAKGGEERHTLNVNEMPKHGHSTSHSGGHTHTYSLRQSGDQNWSGGRGNTLWGPSWQNHTTSNSGAHTHTISQAGGNQSHENRPPYYAICFIMKL